MKITINQNELQNALSIVTKGVSNRSTLPILSGVLLQASQDTLVLQTTDLELSIQYSVDTLVEIEGKTVVPAKLFSEIIKSLPDAAVGIELIDENVIITCDAASFSLKTLNPDDFPSFPAVEADQEIGIPFNQFATMIKKVARVVSKDESRAILTGVLISLNDQTLKMVATDSYRLAITETLLDAPQTESFEAVIAGSFLQDIASMNKTDNLLSLALSENQIVVTYENTVFINRRIEGTFPNYRQLLPESHETQVKVDVSHLIAAVKRISLLNAHSTPIRFDISKDTQTLQISAVAQDVGSAQETIACEITGENTEIAFNYAYILDGLSVVSSDNTFIEVQNSMKPGIFKAEESDNFLYLIMPVRLS